MNPLRLICCLITLVLAAGNAPAQTVLPQAPPDGVTGKLLQQADALIKSGKAVDAYKLLEPMEADHSGEIGFDYLLGVAALDSGKPDRAVIAFERVLVMNPKFAGARMDLARAYFAMGSDDLAKIEFETVLAQSPPEPTAAVIRKHLEVIAERLQARIQKISGYIETSAGRDGNVTAATADNVRGVAGILGRTPAELIALQYQPTGSSLHYASNYMGVASGIDFSRVINEERGLSLLAGADLKQRVYSDIEEMNNLTVDLRAGIGITRGEDRYRLTGTYGQYRQSGFAQTPASNAFRDTTGLTAEWKHNIGTKDQVTWSLGLSRPRFLSQQAMGQDTNQISVNASWLHIFEGKNSPLMYANYSHAIDRALRPVNATTGANVGRTSTGLLVYFQVTPWTETDLFLSGGVTIREDDGPGARSPGLPDFYARDDTQSLSFGITSRPWKKWSIRGAVAITNNHSNLSLYEYRRSDTTFSLRRDF